MSITIKNGSITLKNFAELGSVLDPQTLLPGPQVADSQPTSGSEVTQEAGAAQTVAPHNLASLLAQLSTISTGLDAMARQDAYARDQAALDLARYEALLVDKQETERALAEVRRLRAAAEQLSAEAFTDEARAQAAQHAAGARAAGYTMVRLPGAVAGLFEAWLERHFPDRREKVLHRIREMRGGRLNDPRFGSRMRGEGVFAQQIDALFTAARRRHGLDQPLPELSAAAFQRPDPIAGDPGNPGYPSDTGDPGNRRAGRAGRRGRHGDAEPAAAAQLPLFG